MVKRLFVLTASVFIYCTTAVAGIVEGKVIDADTGEPLIGASVTYAEGKGISTNTDGCFSFDVVNGKCQLTVRYIGYKTVVKDINVSNSTPKIEIGLEADNTTLTAVTVVGEARHDTDAASTREQQEAHVLPAFIPQTGSPLIGAASFSDALLSSWFDKVNYVGAFSPNDNWLNGWTEFDPQNANY